LLLIDGTEATMSSENDPAGLASIARQHRVIIYDHRGVGLSRGDVSQMSIAELADDAARLTRALHLTAVDVWGQSLGACVAEELAIRHPSVVRRLVLTGGLAGSKHFVLGKLAPPGDSAAILKLVFTPDAAGRAAMRGFEKRTALWRPRESVTVPARTAEYAAIAHYLFFSGGGAWEQLPRIRAQVLIANGRRDVVVPPINARIIARRIRHATVQLYPASHFFYSQDQAQFIPALLRFLRAA
jgi:pimeloyl-ACP methyl ester carboxylesterase